MPPYVALALVSFQRVLGDSFLLLTPETVPEYIGTNYEIKEWGFSQLNFDIASSIATIVAKSDFIRMAYVFHQGGVWLDADTLVFKNPSPCVFPSGLTDNLHWYSEAFFGARSGNPLLGKALSNYLAAESHNWGNPGNIKGLITRHPDMVVKIPNTWLDPGYRPLYNFSSCEVMRSKEITVREFLTNPDMKLLKLYNTYFARTSGKQQSVQEFLQSDVLLARLFLSIEPDVRYWASQADALIKRMPPKPKPRVHMATHS